MSVPKALIEQLEHCVDVATHDLLKDSDWKTNFLVVELVNRNRALMPHLMKQIRTRLSNRKAHIRTLTIQLLHMVVANSPVSRLYVAEPDFMKFLIHTLPKAIRKPRKKYLFGGAMPQDVVELTYADLTLLLIKKWAADYHKDGKSLQFVTSYKKLLADGCLFPDPATVEIYANTILPPEERPDHGATTDELLEYHRKEYNEKVRGIHHDISTKGGQGSNVQVADYRKPDPLTPLTPMEQFDQDAQLSKVATEVIIFPDLSEVRFKDSKRAIEVAGMLIDLINAYSPLQMGNPEGRMKGHPRNDGAVQSLYDELSSLLDAVRTAVDSGQIKEDFKVKELLLVHDTLTSTNRYYKDIAALKKIPGQVIRSGQEVILQSYLANQKRLQQEQAQLRQSQQSQQSQQQTQKNSGMMLGPGLDNSRPLSTQYVDQHGRTTTTSNRSALAQDGVIPAVIVPGQTVVSQAGKIQPMKVVHQYDNTNDMRPSTGGRSTGGESYFKPAVSESFESAAAANATQTPNQYRQPSAQQQQQQQARQPSAQPQQQHQQQQRQQSAQQQHQQQRQQSASTVRAAGTPQLGSVPTLGNTQATGTRGGRGQNTQNTQNNQNNQNNQNTLQTDFDLMSFVDEGPSGGGNRPQQQQHQQQHQQIDQRGSTNSIDLLMSLYSETSTPSQQSNSFQSNPASQNFQNGNMMNTNYNQGNNNYNQNQGVSHGNSFNHGSSFNQPPQNQGQFDQRSSFNPPSAMSNQQFNNQMYNHNNHNNPNQQQQQFNHQHQQQQQHYNQQQFQTPQQQYHTPQQYNQQQFSQQQQHPQQFSQQQHPQQFSQQQQHHQQQQQQQQSQPQKKADPFDPFDFDF